MRCSLWIAVMGLMILPLVGLGQGVKKARNPFGVADVPHPDAKDVKDFVARVKTRLKADDKDANAVQWTKEATQGRRGTLDGEWEQRWNGGSAGATTIAGKATIRTLGDRVYILFKDSTNTTYLLDLKREGNYLIGRYMNQGEPSDSTPWFGIIVDDERIDGIWTEGRWDSRRKLDGQPQADDAAPFGDKFVCVSHKSSAWTYTYLENVKLRTVDGRSFLCGTGADVPDQQWQKERTVWIALDDVSAVTAFPTLKELQKAAADQQ